MKRFDRVILNIKSIKIQGATNIALAGMQAYLLQHDSDSVKRILNSRPTEPLLQNCIKLLIKNPELQLKSKVQSLTKQIKNDEQKIAKFGAKLIKSNSNVFSHCHSSSAIGIFLEAKKQKKNFKVFTTTAFPKFQSRVTAKDLGKAKIPVFIVPDLASEQLLDHSSIFIFGADALISQGVVNKLGTMMLAKEAYRKKIPCYCAATMMKFIRNIQLEMRSPKELWNEKSKFIHPINPAFDLTLWKYIKGII